MNVGLPLATTRKVGPDAGEVAIDWISFPSAKVICFFRGNALSWQSGVDVGLLGAHAKGAEGVGTHGESLLLTYFSDITPNSYLAGTTDTI